MKTARTGVDLMKLSFCACIHRTLLLETKLATKKALPVREIQPDITDLIEVLCDIREESYPFEKHVALLTFSAWMIWPQKPEVINHAKIVAAALIIKGMNSKAITLKESERSKHIAAIAEHAMPPGAVAEVVLKRIVWSFRDELIGAAYSIDDVTGIIVFFLTCPTELNPSFNKATFFIDACGYADPNDSAEDQKATRVSPSTLKNSWGRLAVSSPFLFAADYLHMQSIYDLAPDELESVPEAMQYLKSATRLRRFFEVAKYAQETMIGKLDKKTTDRFKFVTFPESIKSPKTLAIEPFDERELGIINRYKAAKFTAT